MDMCADDVLQWTIKQLNMESVEGGGGAHFSQQHVRLPRVGGMDDEIHKLVLAQGSVDSALRHRAYVLSSTLESMPLNSLPLPLRTLTTTSLCTASADVCTACAGL